MDVGHNNVTKEKKKTISIVEDDEHLQPRKRSTLKLRRSMSSDRTISSKAYSYKCGLDDDVMAQAFRSPSLDSLGSSFECPSLNVGVRSMSFDFSPVETLSDLEAVAFAEILREATDRLDLLPRTIPKDEKPKLTKVPERLLSRKKGTCEATHERRMIFPRDADHVPVIVGVGEKLLEDWNVVYNVFRKTSRELEAKGSYDCLRSEVNAIIDFREKKCNLEANLNVWIDLAKRLRDLLESRDRDFECEKREYEEKIEKLAKDIDSSYCVNNEKLDYARRWEASRLEQQNLRQESEKDSILNEIQELEKAKKVDAKVSEELLAYLKYVIDNHEAEVTLWTHRYNDELETREREINEMQEKIEEMQEFLEESRATQAQRQVVIDEYLEEQKKIQAENEYWNNVNKAATLIQAIWRGYMVRHALGPYAYLKKKDKKKKKSGKKAKKKK